MPDLNDEALTKYNAMKERGSKAKRKIQGTKARYSDATLVAGMATNLEPGTWMRAVRLPV